MSAEAEELYNLGFKDGMEQGMKKGIKISIKLNQANNKEAAVMRMLQDKLPVEKIVVYQNMSVDEVRKIEAQMLAEV